MFNARLTLVGAGPGDPDLITVKGIKALADADVVLYDALAHPDLLKYVPDRAEKVFVGKRFGKCVMSQEDINKLIVESALKYGHVVRLKGGDPFVFGRGFEELQAAKEFGISCTVIPGISSAISVPESQNIPLTMRGMSESFWVITGTTKSHALSNDIKNAARSNATVVILMGMHKLAEIVEIFQQENKGELPIAIIQNGTREDEKLGVGVINTIQAIVENEGLTSPAIILIGEVVRLHQSFQKVTSVLSAIHS